MLKQIFVVFTLLILYFNITAQTEKNSAAVKWETYKVSEQKVSVLLPKMPILIESSDLCNDLIVDTYAVYGEEVVYQLKIASKNKREIPDDCQIKNKFSQDTFKNRVAELKIELGNFEETRLNLNGRETTKISGKFTTYWLIDDVKNNRWFELIATARNNQNPSIAGFIKSIKFNKNVDGIEIKNGAARTLGDEEAKIQNPIVEKPEQNTEPMIIVAKPRANYTDMARQKQTQGNVMLKVTFLATGGIGSIFTVTELPYGLTEQAIIAASKIVFLPQKVKGKNVNVTKQVQYSFTIY
ncbi:MAG: TonB family protein [Acidobacteria bacterium]|jgi:hypothetical protein|nr:TonB family protein [Acidobacteriota bacterium]